MKLSYLKNLNINGLFKSTAFLGHNSWQQKHLIQLSKSITGPLSFIEIAFGGHTLLHLPHLMQLL